MKLHLSSLRTLPLYLSRGTADPEASLTVKSYMLAAAAEVAIRAAGCALGGDGVRAALPRPGICCEERSTRRRRAAWISAACEDGRATSPVGWRTGGAIGKERKMRDVLLPPREAERQGGSAGRHARRALTLRQHSLRDCAARKSGARRGAKSRMFYAPERSGRAAADGEGAAGGQARKRRALRRGGPDAREGRGGKGG